MRIYEQDSKQDLEKLRLRERYFSTIVADSTAKDLAKGLEEDKRGKRRKLEHQILRNIKILRSSAFMIILRKENLECTELKRPK